jgi:predicted RNase H-like nuclease (RuvC/YqgF family)
MKIFEKIKGYLHKIQHYDELCDEMQEQKQEITTLKIHCQQYECNIKELEKEVEEKKENVRILKERLTNTQETYNKLEIPTKTLKNLEDIFKVSDKFTLRQIAEYLKNDSFELVKSMADVMVKDNSELITAHLNGALKRNDSLIKLLEKY